MVLFDLWDKSGNKQLRHKKICQKKIKRKTKNKKLLQSYTPSFDSKSITSPKCSLHATVSFSLISFQYVCNLLHQHTTIHNLPTTVPEYSQCEKIDTQNLFNVTMEKVCNYPSQWAYTLWSTIGKTKNTEREKEIFYSHGCNAKGI